MTTGTNENVETLKFIRDQWTNALNGVALSDDDRNDDGEPNSIYDMIAGSLDVRVTIDLNGRAYHSCQIAVTIGGPNIWIDTGDNKIKMYWANEYAEIEIFPELSDAIDDVIREYYEME